MMTITIDAPAEVEAAITQKAAREGLSVSEYVLRAAVEKATGGSALSGHSILETEEDRIRARKETRALIESGYYAWPGVSSEAFMAERSEEAAREEARFQETLARQQKTNENAA